MNLFKTTGLTICAMMMSVGLIQTACAQTKNNAENQSTQLREKIAEMVPESRVTEVDGLEFDVMTKANTKIEIEFNRDNTIDDVSGDNPLNGDVFIPGSGFITLEQAVQSLKEAGKTPTGDWQFEKSFRHGWVYEFDGREDNRDMNYILNAANGELIKASRDWF